MTHTNVFNAIGAPSEDMRRHLLYLAETGNDALVTDGAKPARKRHEAEDNDTRFLTDALAQQTALATAARLEEFETRLALQEQATAEALEENARRLEEAREAFEGVKARAYEVTSEDGMILKVFADGAVVRDESGAIVSSDIITADEIPQGLPTWAGLEAARNDYATLEAEREDLMEQRSQLEELREEFEAGGVSDDRLDEMGDLLSEMPASVASQDDLALSNEAFEHETDKPSTPSTIASSASGPGLG